MQFHLSDNLINFLIWSACFFFIVKSFPRLIADEKLLFAVGFAGCASGLIGFSWADWLANRAAAPMLGTSGDSVFFYKVLAFALVAGAFGIGYVIEQQGKKNFFSLKNWLYVAALLGIVSLSSAMTLMSRSSDFTLNNNRGKLVKAQLSNSKEAIEDLDREYQNLELHWKECAKDGWFGSKECKETKQKMAKNREEKKIQQKKSETSLSKQIVTLDDALKENSPLDGQLIKTLFIIGASFFVPIGNVVLSSGMFYSWRRLIAIYKKKDRNITGDESTITNYLWPSGVGTESVREPVRVGTRAGTESVQSRKKRVRASSVSDQLCKKVADHAVQVAIKKKAWPTVKEVKQYANCGTDTARYVLKQKDTKERIKKAMIKSKSKFKLVG